MYSLYFWLRSKKNMFVLKRKSAWGPKAKCNKLGKKQWKPLIGNCWPTYMWVPSGQNDQLALVCQLSMLEALTLSSSTSTSKRTPPYPKDRSPTCNDLTLSCSKHTLHSLFVAQHVSWIDLTQSWRSVFYQLILHQYYQHVGQMQNKESFQGVCFFKIAAKCWVKISPYYVGQNKWLQDKSQNTQRYISRSKL